MTALPTRPVLTAARPARHPNLLGRLHALIRATLTPDAQLTHDRQRARAALHAEAHRAALTHVQLSGTGGRP
ncbi:hypothetical protein [Deinococcus depolymerans]|uniref:Uncharacterized protein n=1 Tax=Deinococcus depolymerans TaxID=392408 RepID=A0ABN1BZV6_9DEIO